MLVVIKGNVKEAIRAARDREIPFFFCHELNNGNETLGKIPDSYADKVIAWFAESTAENPPYPIGTCLFYRLEDKREGFNWK